MATTTEELDLPTALQLLGGSYALLAVIERDGEIRWSNTQWTRRLGWTPDELSSRSLFALLNESDRALVVEQLETLELDGPLFTCEARVARADGTQVWTVIHITRIGPDTFSIAGRPIEELVQARDELTEQRQLVVAALNALDAPIAIVEESGAIVEVNAQWTKFSPLGQAYVSSGVGENYVDLCSFTADVSGDTSGEVRATAVQAILQGSNEPVHVETEFATETGARSYQVRFTPLVRPNGRRWCVIAYIDITEQVEAGRRVELQARESEMLALVARYTDNAVVITDADGLIRWVNEGFSRMTGYSFSEAVGQKPGGLLQGPGTDPSTVDQMRQAVQQGEGFEVEVLNYTKSGEGRWISIEARPIHGPDGVLTGFIGVESDITERKHMQRELAKERSVLRKVLSTVPFSVWWKDTEGFYLGCNESFAQLAGAGCPDDLVGLTDAALPWPEASKETGRLVDQQVMATLEPNMQLIDSTTLMASQRHVSVSKVPIVEDDGELTGVLGVLEDVTERVAMERQLHDERSLLREVLATMPFRVCWKDRQHSFIGCNPAYATYMGLDSPEDIVGLSNKDLTIMQGGASDELNRLNEEIMVSGTPLLHSPETYVDADGRVHHVSISRVPLREGDEVVGILVLFVDETERRKLEEQLAEARKLEAIGQLAAGVAHEINTPIQYVGDNTRFLQSTFEELTPLLIDADKLAKAVVEGTALAETGATFSKAIEAADLEFLAEEIPSAIDQSLDGIDRVTKIVRAMKDFSHPGSDELTPTDLNKAIESTAAVATNEWKYVADLHLDLADDLPLVPCLPGELNQVILIMIVNAAHAIGDASENGDKGNISVSTLLDGEMAEIRIADDGPGIPAEILEKIYDPFFTTKEVGRGTGQGLAIAQKVVISQHEGTLDVQTEVGVGTTFTIRLPLEHAESDA